VAQPRGHAIRFTPEAIKVLTSHRWPGNVRELRNMVERLAVMAAGDEITAEEVAFHLPNPAPDVEGGLPPLDEVERRHILKVLKHVGGNRTQAAKVLGVDPKTLYNKLKAYSPPAG
jgi:DNA-binding NtrC family response regulator